MLLTGDDQSCLVVLAVKNEKCKKSQISWGVSLLHGVDQIKD
jgi:hypothetical protein